MLFIKNLIYKFLNNQISNVYNSRFKKYHDTPKGVFWNSKLSQDLRLNIILNKIINNLKNNEFSIADVGCGYGRLYEIIRERNLDKRIEYSGYDINKEFINLCKNKKEFKNCQFAVSSFPVKKVDYVIMSGTYNLAPTNNINLWENYIIKNLKSNWNFAGKSIIFNCLIKERRIIDKTLYYSELSWIKKMCEENFCNPEVIRHNLLKEDITIILKKPY